MINTSKLKKILIVKLGSLGDIVHTLPLLHLLRKYYPQSQISWIVEEKSKELINSHQELNDFIIINTKRWRKSLKNPFLIFSTLKEIFASVKRLRGEKYDLTLDVQGLLKSGIISSLTGAKYRVGFNPQDCRERGNAFFVNHHLEPLPDKLHIVEKNLALLKLMGIETEKEERVFNLGYLPEGIEEKIDLWFSREGIKREDRLIGINPGGGWKTKLWGEKKYAQLADNLFKKYKEQIKIILFWGPGEKEMALKINKLSGNKLFISKEATLKELIAYLKRCLLVIGGETGPIHIANALGVPTVVIYGPSSPCRNRPYFGDNSREVVGECPKLGCYKRECPEFICLESIGVIKVTEAAMSLLDPQLKKNRNS